MEIENHYQFVLNGCTAGRLIEALIGAGYSNTRARRAVLEALCEAGGQATPAQLLTLGRDRHRALGLVTVYRTLEVLAALGLVRKLHLEEGCSTYVLSPANANMADEAQGPVRLRAHEHSHHVICRHCHRATEFAGCDIDLVVAAVEVQTGYRVHEHWLEMFGLCPSCQADERGTAE